LGRFKGHPNDRPRHKQPFLGFILGIGRATRRTIFLSFTRTLKQFLPDLVPISIGILATPLSIAAFATGWWISEINLGDQKV